MFVLLLYLHLCLAWGLLINEVISYSSILSVCEAAATWTMALRVLEDFEPDLFSSLGTNRHKENLGGGRWLGIVQDYERGYIEYLSSSMCQVMLLLSLKVLLGTYICKTGPICWNLNVAEVSTVQLVRATKEDSSLWHVDCLTQCCKLLFYLMSPGNTLGSTTPSGHQQCLCWACHAQNRNSIHLSMRMALFQGLFPKNMPSNAGSNITLTRVRCQTWRWWPSMDSWVRVQKTENGGQPCSCLMVEKTWVEKQLWHSMTYIFPQKMKAGW